MATNFGWNLEREISDYIFEWTELIEICKTEIENNMKSALRYNNWIVYNQLHEYLKRVTKLGVDKTDEMEKLENESDIEYLRNNLLYAMDDAYELLIASRKYFKNACLRSNIPRYNMPMIANSTLNTAADRLMQYQQQNPPVQTISQPSIARLQAPTTASRARSQHKFAPTKMPMPRPVQQPTRKQAEQEFQKYQPRIIETQNAGKELLNRAQASIGKTSQTNNQNVQQIIKYSNELTKELYNLQIVANSTKSAGCLNTIRAVSNQMNKLNNAITNYEKIKAQRVASQPLISQNRARLQRQAAVRDPRLSKSTSVIRPNLASTKYSTKNPPQIKRSEKKQADFLIYSTEWKKFKQSFNDKINSFQQEAITNQQTNPNNKNHQIYLTYLNKIKNKFKAFTNEQENILKLAKEHGDLVEYFKIVSGAPGTFGNHINLDKERQRYLVRCSSQATETQDPNEINILYNLWEEKTKLAMNYLQSRLEQPASSRQIMELDQKMDNLRNTIDLKTQEINNLRATGDLQAIKQLIKTSVDNIENYVYEKPYLNQQKKTPSTLLCSQRRPQVKKTPYQPTQQQIERNERQLARQNALTQLRLQKLAQIEANRIVPVPPPTKSRKDYTENELIEISRRKHRLVNTIRNLQTIGKARSTTADIERTRPEQFGMTAKSVKLPPRMISEAKTMTREQVQSEKRRLDKQHNDYLRTAKKIGLAKRRLFDTQSFAQPPIGGTAIKQTKMKAIYQPNANVEPINYQSRSDSIRRSRMTKRRTIPVATRYREVKLGEKGYHRSQIRKIKNQIQNEMKNFPKRQVIVPQSLNAFMPEGLIIDKQIMDGIFWDLYSDDSMKSRQIERMLNDPLRKSDYIAGVKRMNEYEPAVLEYFKAKLLHRFEGYDE